MNYAEWEALSWHCLAQASGAVVRSFVLACLCGCAVWLLRTRTAELRFDIWKWMLMAIFALPILMTATPPVARPSRALWQMEAAVLAYTPNGSVSAGHASVTVPPVTRSFSWFSAVPVIYLLISMSLLARLGYNLIRLRRIAAQSEIIRDVHFREVAHEVWLKSGCFIKPRIAASKHVSSPVTFDSGDSWILIPEWWFRWDESKLRAVLTHEMAHIERGDPQTLLLAAHATCVFWFNPLTWFLRNRLADLAEESCDEAVLAGESTPEQYASFLIDFAADVQQRGGRLRGAIAAVGQAPMKKRIERLFHDTNRRGAKLLTALALLLFIPALYVTAAARPEQAQEKDIAIWPEEQDLRSISSADVVNLEGELRANPEDLQARMKLLLYFAFNGQQDGFLKQITWFIQHHPEVETLQMAQGVYRRPGGAGQSLTEDAQHQVEAAWEGALAAHPNSPVIVFNAARGPASAQPERSLEIVQRLKQSDAQNASKYRRAILIFYAAAEMGSISPGSGINNIRIEGEAAEKLRERLANTHDPSMLADVGEILARFYRPEKRAQYQRGLDLIQQAINLDSANPKWQEALDSAKAEPKRQATYQRLMQPGLAPFPLPQ